MSSTAVPQELGAPCSSALGSSSPGAQYDKPSSVLLTHALAELEDTVTLLRASMNRLVEAERSTRATMPADAGNAGNPGGTTNPFQAPGSSDDHGAANDLLRWIDIPADRPNAIALARLIRDQIAAALFSGTIAPGARLPSIRDLARHFGINHKTAGRVYEALAVDRVLELRPRSGAYVSGAGCTAPALAAPPDWIARMLADASERPDGVASLPELIARVLGARELTCACVDATEDLRVGLTSEVRNRFGLRVYPLVCDECSPGERPMNDRRARDLDAVDFVITTPWHQAISRLTRELGKPIAVVSPDPSNVAAIGDRLVASPMQLICVDSAFGERFRSLQPPGLRDRVRVLALDRSGAIEQLDPTLPYMISEAARSILPLDRARDAIPLTARLGPESSFEIARLIAGLIHPW